MTTPLSMPRRALMGAGAAGLAGLGLPESLAASGAAPTTDARAKDAVNVRGDGTYDQMPLRKDVTTVSVCQTRVRQVDARAPAADLKANLAHMLELIDAANGVLTGRKDLLLFHEFPITGYSSTWTRAEALRVAIESPGEQTEAIGQKAKQYGCYVVFGSYARDKDWPNHLLSITTTIGPDGMVAGKSWKIRNIRGIWPGFELFTSTVYDNLDRFVEMYGWDQVVPVMRTDIGNLTTTSTQREPELARAAAIKGCEIFLRTATGGFSRPDAQATALYNGIYSCTVNNAVSPDNGGFFASDEAFGGSVIFDPQGKVVAEAGPDNEEQQVVGRLPMAEFRRRHRQPLLHLELYKPVLDRYVGKYPPNLLGSALPETTAETAKYLADKARWK